MGVCERQREGWREKRERKWEREKREREWEIFKDIEVI